MMNRLKKPAPIPATREHSAIPKKAKGADLRTDYGLTLQGSLATSLLILIGLFHMSFESGSGLEVVVAEQEIVEMEEINQTKQENLPPPPPKPLVPIEVANDQILEDDFLDLDASLDLNEPVSMLPGPPPPKEEEVPESTEAEIFVVVEEMPEIIGGVASLNALLEYPPLARQAGLEGLVVVKVVVEPDGSVSSPEVMRSAGDLLDMAAVKAVSQLRFKPGKQRGKAVRVSYAVPVRFRLRDQ